MAEKYGKKVREFMVKEMKDIISGKKGFVLSSVENTKASEMDTLRKKMKKSGTRYFVIKNRLAGIALKEAGIGEIADTVSEQKTHGIGIIEEDPVIVAKMLTDFSKANKGFQVQSGYLEGRVLSAERIKELADLPGREQLIAIVLGTMNAPITGFVGVLSSLVKSVLYALNAVKDKKEKGE